MLLVFNMYLYANYVVTINIAKKKKKKQQTIIDTHAIDLSAICMAAVSL